MADVYDQATNVAAEDGAVVLDGPDGVAVSMTPHAAEETSDRLLKGALEAHGQSVIKKKEEDARKRPRT